MREVASSNLAVPTILSGTINHESPTPCIETFLDCDLESVKQLLAGGVGINLHYKPNGRTALHNVAEEMLVDSTPMVLARRYKHEKAIPLLQK